MPDYKKIHTDQETAQGGGLPDEVRPECPQEPSGTRKPEDVLSRSWGEETWTDQIPL